MSLQDLIVRLRADLAAATPGPWRNAGGYLTVRDPNGGSFNASIYHIDEMGQSSPVAPFQAVPFSRREDAAAIVAAVNAAPTLIDIAEAAAKFREADRRYIAKLDNDDDDCEKAYADSEAARANLFAVLDRTGAAS